MMLNVKTNKKTVAQCNGTSTASTIPLIHRFILLALQPGILYVPNKHATHGFNGLSKWRTLSHPTCFANRTPARCTSCRRTTCRNKC